MKEFIEKLIGRLEKVSIPIFDKDTEMESKVIYTDIAINTINQLAEEYKNTNIITDFLQYARDNADNYDTNEGWSLADLTDLSIKYSDEYINTSTDTSTTNADRIRSMTDEELAEFISKYFSCEYECAVRDKCGSDWDCKRATIDWLQSEVEGGTDELS